jgi:hypothetical protein
MTATRPDRKSTLIQWVGNQFLCKHHELDTLAKLYGFGYSTKDIKRNDSGLIA